MYKHYILYLESDLNRVFNNSVGQLAATEVAAAIEAGRPHRTRTVLEGPIRVVTGERACQLHFASCLEPKVLGPLVGQLSATMALFERRGELLAPVPTPEQLRFDSRLVTTQRYKGKTNERLTRAMLTMALSAAEIPLTNPGGQSRSITVADPLCGRGTTLNWALAYGFDAIGIEPNPAALDHYTRFITEWAKRLRLPHRLVTFRQNNAERRAATFTVGLSRRELKEGFGQQVQLFCADGGDRNLPIRRGTVDVIVADFPYGIHHSGRGGTPAGGHDRWDPPGTAELLAGFLPAWRKWVRPGGALAFAWNTKRAGADRLASLVEEYGFTVWRPRQDDLGMAHPVDSTIDRDVLIAKRPGTATGEGQTRFVPKPRSGWKPDRSSHPTGRV